MLEGREFVLFSWPKSMRGLETQFEAMMEALNGIKRSSLGQDG